MRDWFTIVVLGLILIALFSCSVKVYADCGFKNSFLYGKNLPYAWAMGYCDTK